MVLSFGGLKKLDYPGHEPRLGYSAKTPNNNLSFEGHTPRLDYGRVHVNLVKSKF